VVEILSVIFCSVTSNDARG